MVKDVEEALTPDILNEDKYERSKRIAWIDMEKIQRTKVLVIGAGATGNEVLKNLVLSGYKNITIVDMDYVFHTKKIESLPKTFIPSFDVVLGCLDNIAARLHVNAICYHHGIPYIDSGTDGLVGKVQVVLPPKTACIECALNKTHAKVLEKRFSCSGINITFFEPKLAAEITTTSIVSAIQVREALKITNGMDDLLINNLFYYDGKRNVSEILEIPINPGCSNHYIKK
jgi:molybdopterin/thiamine biosynthesis adenylyltransferase